MKEVGERSEGGLVSQIDQLRNNQMSVRPVSGVRKRGEKRTRTE